MLRVTRCETPGQVGELAAEALAGYMAARAGSVVGLPTGRTAEPVYRAVAEMGRASRFDPSRGLFFALDELVCRSGRRLFFDFLLDLFLRPCGVGLERFRILDPESGDHDQECLRYEAEIREAGGFGIVLLGIGRNGHIAFNEPGSSFDSVTRRVELLEDTKAAVAQGFGTEAADIAGALTVGIGTILGSEKVLLLATGAEKAKALRDALAGEPDPGCPASALGLHSDAEVIADAEALSLVG